MGNGQKKKKLTQMMMSPLREPINGHLFDFLDASSEIEVYAGEISLHASYTGGHSDSITFNLLLTSRQPKRGAHYTSLHGSINRINRCIRANLY